MKPKIKSKKEIKQIYELLFDLFCELNMTKYCDYLIDNNFLSEEFILDLVNNKKNQIKEIKNNEINVININNFSGLKIYEIDNYKIPFYCLGILNNNYYVRTIDDKELYIYDSILNIKIRVDYNFSKHTNSLFQMDDGNLIIVYSSYQKVCIIEIKKYF